MSSDNYNGGDTYVLPEVEDRAMLRLPRRIKEYLWYDAVVPISASEIAEARDDFFNPLSDTEIMLRLKRFSRDIHLKDYGGKRPEDG